MPKYIVSYDCIESYEKEYEAASAKDAEDMFDTDYKLFESSPRISEVNLMDVREVDGAA